MERHGIATAKTVVPADEVADASTAAGEAPDAATLRPRQGSGSSSSKDKVGPARPVGDLATASAEEGANVEAVVRADPARHLSDGPADAR